MKMIRLAIAACLLGVTHASATVVFFETFGDNLTNTTSIGDYASNGDNGATVTATSERLLVGTSTPQTNGSTGIRYVSSTQRSNNSNRGAAGASGGNLLQFSSESSGYISSQWYQFDAIPLAGHVGDSLEISLLFRPNDASLSDLGDYFTLSVSWDNATFTEVDLTFANGNHATDFNSWKTVVGSALAIEGESVWVRITANPLADGSFAAIRFDDIRLTATAAVPEPASFALLAGGASLVLMLLRRLRENR